MELKHETKEGKIPVSILHVSGRLDASNYKDLINQAKDLIDGGAEYLLMDLAECDFLSSAGIFALHSIAMLAHQLVPFDPEDGWHALHRMQEETDRSLKDKFKIVNLQPRVAHTLEISGVLQFLDIFTDSQEALEAFGA
jgi:anti-anti-sigma regulatory factor